MRHHRSCALLHTLSRRSQLSVGSCGSMLHDRVLAPRPRPWAWRTFIALSCAMTGANAARKRSSLGLHKGGYSALVHVFTRPGGGVRGRLLLWGSLGVSNGYGFQVPCSVRRGAPSCERAVLSLSLLACSRPGSAFRDVSQLGRTDRVLDPVPISRRRVIV